MVRVGTLLVSASVVLAVAARASDTVKWYGLTLGAAGLVLIALSREARAYGMVDLSNPMLMSLIASVLIFGVFGAPNVFPGTTASLLLPRGHDPLFRALFTVGISMLCLWAGSRIAEPVFRARPQPLRALAVTVPYDRAAIVVVVGAAARLLLLVTGNLGYQGFGKSGDLTGYANWVATANDLLPFAAGLFLADWIATRRRASFNALGALFVAEVLTSIIAGVKGLVLTLLVILAVVALRAGRRPSLRIATATGALFLVVIAPSVETFRHQVQQSGAPTSLSSRITAPLSLVAGGSGSSLKSATSTYQNTLYEERSLLVDIALIQARTPSIYPYERGKRWLLAPLVATVPRALWPGKPSLSNGGEIAIRYGGAGAGTSQPATMVGDAWIQFGWLGVIGASLALGAFYRLAYTWVVRRHNAGWTIALCFVVATSLFSGGLDVASLLTSATREFIVLGVVAAWVLRPATPASDAPPLHPGTTRT
jgi:hypothetical protein